MGLAKKFADFVASSVFPKVCLLCGSFLKNSCEPDILREDFCENCSKGFTNVPQKGVCVCCLNTAHGGERPLCANCLQGRVFSSARSVFFFSGSAADAAKRFKYGGDFSIGRKLSSISAAMFTGDLDFDILVPVPLHPRRLRQREFNQSSFLSSKIAKILNKEHAPMTLERVKDTRPQASILNKEDRRRNVKGIFRVREKEKKNIRGAKVLLFDDIFTTGATVEECSKAIVSAGAERVCVFTVFKTRI